MPSIPSIPGGGAASRVAGSEQTVWWLVAGRRGKVGIAWESSAAYRGRNLYFYSVGGGHGVFSRVIGMLVARGKEYTDTASAEGHAKARRVVQAYFQYCFLTAGVSDWTDGRDPAAVGCARQLWPYTPLDDLLATWQGQDPILTARQAAAFG